MRYITDAAVFLDVAMDVMLRNNRNWTVLPHLWIHKPLSVCSIYIRNEIIRVTNKTIEKMPLYRLDANFEKKEHTVF